MCKVQTEELQRDLQRNRDALRHSKSNTPTEAPLCNTRMGGGINCTKPYGHTGNCDDSLPKRRCPSKTQLILYYANCNGKPRPKLAVYDADELIHGKSRSSNTRCAWIENVPDFLVGEIFTNMNKAVRKLREQVLKQRPIVNSRAILCVNATGKPKKLCDIKGDIAQYVS